MWPYCGNSAGIWRCPADSSRIIPAEGPWAGKSVPRIRSMAMSIWVGGREGTDAGCSGPEWRVFSKWSELNNPGPSMTWVLCDQR